MTVIWPVRESRGVYQIMVTLWRLSQGQRFTSDIVFGRKAETIMYIVGIVQDVIVRPTKRSCALPPVIMVLAALRFLACGSFYQVVSDTIRVSKSSVWKAVHEVTGRLARQDVVRRFVRLAGDDNATKAKFHQLAGKWTQLIPCHS